MRYLTKFKKIRKSFAGKESGGKIKIRVSGKEMRYIRYMEDQNFNEYLLYKIRQLRMYMEDVDEKFIKKKIEKTRETIELMKSEIPLLEEFYRRAERDEKRMEEWVDMLDRENEELLRRIKK